jgi:uncharacterized protein
MALSRRLTVLLALWSALFAAASLRAATVVDLYEAAQPVEGSRDAAFVEALKTVIVRVSGQRDAAARVGAAINHPQRYVQHYGFTADGVLQVGFDSVSVDRLLAESGLPIWGRERPATLVMVNVTDPYGTPRWLTGEGPAPEQEAIAKAARARGLPLKWPVMDSQERMEAGDAQNAAAGLLQTAARYGANAALVGHARGGAIYWTLVSSDGVAQATGGLEEGVHLAADNFARVFAASGASLGSVLVEVSGITNLDAYAATLNYLEGMTLVRAVALEQVSHDTMRFRLAVRGDAMTLRRAIALDSRLVPVPAAGTDAAVTPGAGERLAFRYQP